MKAQILTHLQALEQEKGVKILLACETGSRAWGFPSPDSDYDVRLLYVHPVEWYLRLNEGKDNVDLMFANGDIDISGWDLRKALGLLRKSNCALLERIQSPFIYHADEDFVQEINQLAPQYYSRIASVYHYLSMGQKVFEEVQEKSEYRLKRLFYALRAATACLWIITREEIPPIQFPEMLSGLDIPQALVNRIEALIAMKATASEAYYHRGEAEILAFIGESLEKAKALAGEMPPAHAHYEPLNTFFIQTLNTHWG